MARPRSKERHDAILAAAVRVFAAEGLGASTAAIAKEAGVSNGSLFVYFETKPVLVNELYIALKTEMAAVATRGLPTAAGAREQVSHMWKQWVAWASSAPEKRRTLAQLEVSDDITAQSRHTVAASFADVAALLEHARAGGPMQDTAPSFVLAVISGIADAAIDAILAAPTTAQAQSHSRDAFDAIWRTLAGTDSHGGV